MNRKFPHAELCFIESGGDNLAATFSPELADLTIYVIDVAEGEKIPRKGGPGITRSDLLVINKIDLAPLVGANRGDGSGYAENARKTTIHFYEFKERRRCRSNRKLHYRAGLLSKVGCVAYVWH